MQIRNKKQNQLYDPVLAPAKNIICLNEGSIDLLAGQDTAVYLQYPFKAEAVFSVDINLVYARLDKAADFVEQSELFFIDYFEAVLYRRQIKVESFFILDFSASEFMG